MDEASADATRFSHLTNNRIRYHNSGIEKRQRETTDALRKELSSLAGAGGSRTVSLSISADALIGIDVEWGKLQAKAGMSGAFTASIKVANGGGRVDVTYTKGVDVHGGAEAKLGTNPEDSNALPGAGGRDRGGDARRTSARHDEVAVVRNRQDARRLCKASGGGSGRGAHQRSRRRAGQCSCEEAAS